MREDDRGGVAVSPAIVLAEFQGMFVSAGAHDIAVDGLEKGGGVLTGYAFFVGGGGVEPGDAIVFPGDEAIEAGDHVDRYGEHVIRFSQGKIGSFSGGALNAIYKTLFPKKTIDAE